MANMFIFKIWIKDIQYNCFIFWLVFNNTWKYKKKFKLFFLYLDPDQWIPAAVNTDQPLGNVTGFMSIPVEIKIVTQADGTLEISNIVYTITDFRPFIDLEIEEYTVIFDTLYNFWFLRT